MQDRYNSTKKIIFLETVYFSIMATLHYVITIHTATQKHIRLVCIVVNIKFII